MIRMIRRAKKKKIGRDLMRGTFRNDLRNESNMLDRT